VMLAYRFLWWLLLPMAALRLMWRAWRDPLYRAQAMERFAWHPPDGPFDLWVHAVSVGETRAAETLIKRVLRDLPHARILLTHMTPTGRAAASSFITANITQRYLPYDHAWLVRRFVARAQAKVLCIMETEVWPELLVQARGSAMPVFLVNARLSEKSARGYARVSPLSSIAFSCFTTIFAQADADADRFKTLGARDVQVLGNLKFDCEPPSDLGDRIARLRNAIGQRSKPTWVAGSTREGDEALLLAALQSHPLRTHAQAIVVPRHPQRFEEVFALAQSLGFRVAKRSTMQPNDDIELIIGDSMGEMFAYYACADVAFIGGSFNTGSQNLIEPCAVGVPVVFGPSTFNFAAAAAAALEHGAAIQVADASGALDAISHLLTDHAQKERMIAAAQQFTFSNRGATEKTWVVVKSALETR
jgi:3-deoxy-D-manno-octulosonic-acid transferase